ncbi:MAG TPA: SRPBCC family protein [Actinomycetota bacterium]|nr:SRPBCC family protein [Actinomycetota bacterium]
MMDIDRGAPAIADGEIEISAPAGTVWTVLADLAAWPTWNRDVRSVTLEGPVEPGTVFRWKSGPASLVSTLQVVDEPREIAWTGVTMRIHAVHVFRLSPSDGGTSVRSEESWRGLIPTLFRGYSRRTLRSGIESVLAALKLEAERRAGR